MSKYSNERVPGKEHIPLYPKGFIAVRIIQLIIAIVCLGLCGFGVTYFSFAGDGLMLFTAIATLITSIYCLVARYGPPKAFNYWAILGLDIFLVIFWLISFSILAVDSAAILSYYDIYSDYYGYVYSQDVAVTIYGACLAAAAGLGGVEFILYIVSLSIHGVMLHRHRKAGLKAMPGHSTSANTPIAAPVSVGGGQFQMQPQNPQPYPTPGSPPPPGQQMYSPPQEQKQQQSFYPPQETSTISTQFTGNSTYAQPMNQGHPVYEVPDQPRLQHNQ